MLIHVPVSTPIRAGRGFGERWAAEDKGLIACWERGREMARERPVLAEAACRGELVPLPWKGGVEAALKSGRKVGTHFYLAMWLGLRGDDLVIDTEAAPELTCSRFGVRVMFSGRPEDYANA